MTKVNRKREPFQRTYLIYICCNLLIIMVASGHVVSGLKCYCNPKECDSITSEDCPGKGYVLWDPCKCCRTCAKIKDESCGGPGGFSGTCEPPLQCVAEIPINNGIGVCKELPQIHAYLNCTNESTILVEAGCEIANKRCKCWPERKLCRDDAVYTDIRWHFKTLEDCQLNLQNLIKIEMEFDEDYTLSPSQTYIYKRIRRKRKVIRK